MASYRLKRKIFFMGSGNFAKAVGTTAAAGLGVAALTGGYAAKTANDVITGKPLER